MIRRIETKLCILLDLLGFQGQLRIQRNIFIIKNSFKKEQNVQGLTTFWVKKMSVC